MEPRWFTPRTARRALVRIRPLANRISRLYRRLEQSCPPRVAGEQPVAPSYFSTLQRMKRLTDELERRGARLRDPRLGLVDFPARRRGREVLLCWRLGESRVRFWHEVAEGFGGRRIVDEDGPWDEGAASGENDPL